VFVLKSLEFKFVITFRKNHSVSQYKVRINILTNTCTKWNTIKQKKNHKIQFMLSTLTCFGTGVLFSGSLLKQGNTSTDRPRCHNENIQILEFKNTQGSTNINPTCHDTKALWQPIPVKTRSSLYFVCSIYSNISLDVCNPEGSRQTGRGM